MDKKELNKDGLTSKRIKEFRIRCGMTQEELAKSMGYRSRSSINKIEKGKSDIPLPKIEELASILGTTPEYLMGWGNDNEHAYHYEAEEFLFLLYGRLNTAGQEKLIEYAEMLCSQDKFKKNPCK